MKRLINIFSMIILLASCVQESIEPAQQITGLYALDNGTGLTNEYIKFDKGKLSDFISKESFPLAENHIWDDGEAAFKIMGFDRYSIKDGKYTTSSNTFSSASISKDGDDGLIFGSKSYVRLDGFKKEPYSSIHPEKYAYENPLREGEYFFPVSVTNPIAAGSLTANSSSSWISGIVMTGGLLRYQLSSTKTPREGKITLKYTHAEDVQVTIHQIPATFIRLEETSKTVGYESSSVEIPYVIENPLNGTNLTVSTTEGWIKDITVLENKVTFTTEENNTGDTRTANLTFSYDGAENVQFSLIQNWSAVSIELMPDSESFDYAGGYGSFSFKVKNPREGIACTAQSQENWITNVSESGNTVSYKVNENNTGATRIGKIQLKYGTYAVVEFTVKQEWAASEIVLTPSFATVPYTGGSGSFAFEVQNPREGVVCVVKNQESWITNVVKTSGNSASYSVNRNNSATARTGKILITYGSYAEAEFVVAQTGQPVTSVTLNKTNLALYVGESETLVATVIPYDAQLLWSSSSPTIATVSSSGEVRAVKPGKSTITVVAVNGGLLANCEISVAPALTELGKTFVAVDLGLPSGLKWASFNLGATTPEEYGNYYAWGETDSKEYYDWSTYKWCYGSYNTLSKYCSKSEYGSLGFTDSKTVLDSEDDAATVALGGTWRVATYAEWEELKSICSWRWSTKSGVNGMWIKGSNNREIFLPAGGDMAWDVVVSVGQFGLYWSSVLESEYYPDSAYGMMFGSDRLWPAIYTRQCGLCIRPVCE